jgi:hypothetical protein
VPVIPNGSSPIKKDLPYFQDNGKVKRKNKGLGVFMIFSPLSIDGAFEKAAHE